MVDVQLWFLDRIRIVQGGEEVAGDVLPRKLLALLGILTTEATHTASADRVCHLLWPDVEEQLARKSLNQLLVRGRRVLPEAVERPAEHLVGLSAGVWCDVHDLLFLDASRAATVAVSAGFEFLPGFSVRGCPELNDWLDAARAVVRARAARVALDRAERSPPADAMSWAVLAYRLDRADERAAAAYIRSMAAVKGPAAAWAAFTDHRRWLADELDIVPSAKLTASVAEACRQAAAHPPVAEAVVAGHTSGTVLEAGVSGGQGTIGVRTAAAAGPGGGRQRAASLLTRRLKVLAGLGVISILSALALRGMRTPAIEAGTRGADVVLRLPFAGGAAADSAIRLASAHLAQHGVVTEVVEGPGAAAGLRLYVPGWHGDPVKALTIAPEVQEAADRLAAALTDSAFALVSGNARRTAAATRESAGASHELLRAADSALVRARALIATGGPSAALLMLQRADSLASRAGQVRGHEWQADVMRAQIANQTFWNQLAAGSMDAGVLHRGIRLADTAIEHGGGIAALKARGALSLTLWISGATGAEAAGKAAQRDYTAIVASTPGDAEAWTRLAQLYHADGRFSDAYSAVLQALPLVSGIGRLDALMELFLAALDRRDNDRAKHWCSELAFHHPDSWFAATCSAMYAWADPASTYPIVQSGLFDESTALRPSLEAQLALLNAGADLVRGHRTAALARIGLARPAVDRYPELAGIWAGILVELGRPDSALATLRAYLEGAPSRRAIVGRPWLRPLYRPNENWQTFLARLSDPAPQSRKQDPS